MTHSLVSKIPGYFTTWLTIHDVFLFRTKLVYPLQYTNKSEVVNDFIDSVVLNLKKLDFKDEEVI